MAQLEGSLVSLILESDAKPVLEQFADVRKAFDNYRIGATRTTQTENILKAMQTQLETIDAKMPELERLARKHLAKFE